MSKKKRLKKEIEAARAEAEQSIDTLSDLEVKYGELEDTLWNAITVIFDGFGIQVTRQSDVGAPQCADCAVNHARYHGPGKTHLIEGWGPLVKGYEDE